MVTELPLLLGQVLCEGIGLLSTFFSSRILEVLPDPYANSESVTRLWSEEAVPMGKLLLLQILHVEV